MSSNLFCLSGDDNPPQEHSKSVLISFSRAHMKRDSRFTDWRPSCKQRIRYTYNSQFITLGTIQIRLGVRKLLELLDLQAPIFVSNDMHDTHRLASRDLRRTWALPLAGNL